MTFNIPHEAIIQQCDTVNQLRDISNIKCSKFYIISKDNFVTRYQINDKTKLMLKVCVGNVLKDGYYDNPITICTPLYSIYLAEYNNGKRMVFLSNISPTDKEKVGDQIIRSHMSRFYTVHSITSLYSVLTDSGYKQIDTEFDRVWVSIFKENDNGEFEYIFKPVKLTYIETPDLFETLYFTAIAKKEDK